MKYANLVIDNKSDQTDQLYTYGVKDDAKIGSKVYVPFAKSRNLREAYVVETDEHSGDGLGKRLRYIEKVDDDVSLSCGPPWQPRQKELQPLPVLWDKP